MRKNSKKRYKSNGLTLESRVRSVSLKFYAEQLMPPDIRAKYEKLHDSKSPADQIKARTAEKHAFAFLRDRVEHMDHKYMCASILHDKDLVRDPDDPFEASIKKGHFHVYIWRRKESSRFYLREIVAYLGLIYDHKKDAMMWTSHGAEVIRDKCASMMYITHETTQAILDGKHQYDVAEVIKNFSDDEFDQLRAGYKRPSPKKRLTADDWDSLSDMAYDLGRSLGDYDKWVLEHLNTQQQAQAPAKIVEKRYVAGLQRGVTETDELTRCSILIYGAAGLGKSTTVRQTLKELGYQTCYATAGTGKYDSLRVSDTAIFFDDVSVKSPLSVFDNAAVILHRRGSHDRPWLGSMAVATTNLEPATWLAKHVGFLSAKDARKALASDDSSDRAEQYRALESRLYICRLDDEGTLQVEHAQSRGGVVSKQAHDAKFAEFKTTFEKLLKQYLASDLQAREDSGDYDRGYRLAVPVTDRGKSDILMRELCKLHWIDKVIELDRMSEPTLDGLYAAGLLPDWFDQDLDYEETWMCQNYPPIKSSDYIGDVLPGTVGGIKLFRPRTGYMYAKADEADENDTMYLYSQQLCRLFMLIVDTAEFLELGKGE